jgi:hypothetical protein
MSTNKCERCGGEFFIYNTSDIVENSYEEEIDIEDTDDE